ESSREELQLERQRRTRPQVSVRPEADIAILVIVHIPEYRRKLGTVRLVRLARKFLRTPVYVLEAEGLLFPGRGGSLFRGLHRERGWHGQHHRKHDRDQLYGFSCCTPSRHARPPRAKQ